MTTIDPQDAKELFAACTWLLGSITPARVKRWRKELPQGYLTQTLVSPAPILDIIDILNRYQFEDGRRVADRVIGL